MHPRGRAECGSQGPPGRLHPCRADSREATLSQKCAQHQGSPWPQQADSPLLCAGHSARLVVEEKPHWGPAVSLLRFLCFQLGCAMTVSCKPRWELVLPPGPPPPPYTGPRRQWGVGGGDRPSGWGEGGAEGQGIWGLGRVLWGS